jgi:hypothetical protein
MCDGDVVSSPSMSDASANLEPGSLLKLFNEHTGSYVHKWSNYFAAYEPHFAPYVGKSPLIFEIGVSKGGSLQLWKKYFGPGARIVGVDIDPTCALLEEEQVSVRIGAQGDQRFLETILQEFGAPDIVIDDGSHISRDIHATFDVLYPAMKSSGVYVVEDLHTNYWADFGGGLYKPSTFIERVKGLIDEIHAGRTRGSLLPTAFTSTLQSISIYESIAVFTKAQLEVFTDVGRGQMVPGDPKTFATRAGDVVQAYEGRRNPRRELIRLAIRRMLRKVADWVS